MLLLYEIHINNMENTWLAFFGIAAHISIRPHCHLATFSTFLVCIHEALVARTENAAHVFLVIFLSSKVVQAFHGFFRSSYDCQ